MGGVWIEWLVGLDLEIWRFGDLEIWGLEDWRIESG